jgi:predicted transporter
MTTEDDLELKQWAADWQAAPDDPASADKIRQYVARRGRLLWSFAIADAVVGGIALPVVLYRAFVSRSGVERLAMLGLALITVVAVMFGWWNRRGVLRSSATTMTDFVAISAERLRRMRMAWRAGWFVLIAQVVVFSIWIWDRVHSSTSPLAPGYDTFAWGWLAGFTLLAGFGMAKFGRWVSRDAERFEALKRELERD